MAAKAPKDQKTKLVSTKNGIIEVKVDDKPNWVETKKFVRVSEKEPSTRFKEIGDQVAKKELKWAYYTTESSTGIHYYQILNVQI